MKTLNCVTVMYCRQHTVHSDPAIWQPSFNLPHHTGSLLNSIETVQGQGLADLGENQLSVNANNSRP